MGLFDFLKKKESGPIIQDWVWVDQEAKMKGCLQILKGHDSPRLAAWSTVTQKQFQDFLLQETGRQVKIDLASYLNPSNEKVYFLEHHPQKSKEMLLFEAIKIKEAIFLNALDDPLMQIFGGERIASMMEKMGMGEEEAITHKMISNSIGKAQEKMDDPEEMEKQSLEFKEWAESIKDY